MPLPKRKTSHARTTQRRSANYKLSLPNPAPCPRCNAPKLPHHVCLACGFYGNRRVLEVRSRRTPETEGEEGGQE